MTRDDVELGPRATRDDVQLGPRAAAGLMLENRSRRVCRYAVILRRYFEQIRI